MARTFCREETLERLRAAAPAVLPSLLASDFANLEREVASVEASGVTALHLDIMDGHFVPNLSFGLPVVEAVRRVSHVPLDVHLMIDNPGDFVERFRAAGADSITIHAEAVDDPRPLLDRIRGLGAIAGLAVNPNTPLSQIEASLPDCDLVLVMSVMPGFGGQEFDPKALEKLRALRAHRRCDALLEVDGGVTTETIEACAAAGADLFVAGTAVFHSDDYAVAIGQLQSLARAGVGMSESVSK
ncbi:MAG: ribulose-phosphate 3-epimerase [Pirellulales bacterium]